jgi:N-acetylmuramoyl-L-alanine amidase
MSKTYNLTEKLLTINNYSRPAIKMNKIKGIVIHWVANPNSTALANRNFFENRKNGNSGYGSAHEIIDLDGSVIVDIPSDEISYNAGSTLPYTTDALKYLSSYPNNCTYGIECTHIDWNGVMTDATYNTLVNRVADLMIEFDLVGAEKPLWLHQEVVGWKDCHRWFVNNPDEWINFKNKVNVRCYEILISRHVTLGDITITYLKNYKYAQALLKELYNSIINKTYSSWYTNLEINLTNATNILKLNGLQSITIDYLKKYEYGEALIIKLAKAMI